MNLVNIDTICRNAILHESKIMIDAENHTLQKEINLLSDEIMKIHNKNSVFIYKTYRCIEKMDYPHLLKILFSSIALYWF